MGTTTALFAELMVGGVLTLTWLMLAGMTALGPAVVTPFLDGSPLATAVVLAFAYSLGVVFDRLWDSLLESTGLQTWMRSAGRWRIDGEKSKSRIHIERKRQRVYGTEKTAVEFVNYHRSRMRVARASFFNFVLITASGLALLAVHHGGIGTRAFALALTAGLGLCLVSGIALWKLGTSQDWVLHIVQPEYRDGGTDPG